ncbi:hypothetical protein ACOSP7_022266 [Xanthoceras sorbifolium]
MATTNFALAGIVNEKLTEDNYENWKESLKSYLIAQGLWDVVSGKQAKPKESDDANYEMWSRKNAMALHAMQLSCGADTISKLRGSESAKYEWERLAEKQPPPLPEGRGLLANEGTGNDIFQYDALYKAVNQGDWEATRDFLEIHPNAVSAKITLKGDTALHLAVLTGHLNIVEELVELMSAKDLELRSGLGYTAFSIAAINEFKDMVEAMLNKNANLVSVKNDNGLIPIVVASLYGSKDMVRYLYSKTPIQMLSPENQDRSGATLLNCLITDGIYDVALNLLKTYPLLGVTEDLHRNYAIKLLAHKLSAFPSGNKFIFWKQWIYSFPDIKHIYDIKLRHAQALELLRCIFKETLKLSNTQLEIIGLDQAIYDAIKHGIIEFVDELIECNPEIIWRKDKKGRTIFAHAVVLRQEKIFSHVYRLGAKLRIAVLRHDIFGNNFLHLAAKLSPASRLDRISGAALQMQRELQWFKEVQNMVPPKYIEELNENNKTPSALFSEEHQELMREGERWMKNTAASCMVVATLIAAVMFTSAFTFPGGNDNATGVPIFLWYNAFLIFVMSNAIALFSSSTSVLVFLGILTSRYQEKDFLKSSPTKLIIGLFSLFFSIVTMMLAFGSAVSIILKERLEWVAIPVIVLSAIPVAFFALSQFPLLVEMATCTYWRDIFDKPKKDPLK